METVEKLRRDFMRAKGSAEQRMMIMVRVLKKCEELGYSTAFAGHWGKFLRPVVDGRCTISSLIMCAGRDDLAERVDMLIEEEKEKVQVAGVEVVLDSPGKQPNVNRYKVKPVCDLSPKEARRVFDGPRIASREKQVARISEDRMNPERDDILPLQSYVVKSGYIWAKHAVGTTPIPCTKLLAKQVQDELHGRKVG